MTFASLQSAALRTQCQARDLSYRLGVLLALARDGQVDTLVNASSEVTTSIGELAFAQEELVSSLEAHAAAIGHSGLLRLSQVDALLAPIGDDLRNTLEEIGQTAGAIKAVCGERITWAQNALAHLGSPEQPAYGSSGRLDQSRQRLMDAIA